MEVRRDVDAAARVRRQREHVSPDGVGKPLRCGAVRRVDRACDLEERDPRLAPARDGEVVVTDGVVHRPGTERDDRRREGDGDARDDPAPAAPRDERYEHAGEQGDLGSGPAERHQRDPDTDGGEPPVRTRSSRRGRPLPPTTPGGTRRPGRSTRRGRDPRRSASRAGRGLSRAPPCREIGATAHAQPRMDSAYMHANATSVRRAAAGPHRDPGDERRDRRAEHLERGERGITVGELEERQPVVPRVPSSLERPGERLERVARERGEDEGRAPAGDEPLGRA